MIHVIALLVTACAFVLLLIVNLGTTFDSSFLPKVYLIKITESVTNKYITYGIYNSCLYSSKDGNSSVDSCTAKMPGYPFDTRQFAELCGASMDDESSIKMYTDILDLINLKLFRTFVFMPAVIFAFIAMICTLIIRKYRRNNIIPVFGAFVSLLGFISGAAGLILTIVTFWKGLETLERRIEGLSHQWGPAIYLIGISVGLLLAAVVCFLISIFTYNRGKSSSTHSRDTLQLYDYDINQRHQQQQASAASPFAVVEPSSPSLMYSNSPATAHLQTPMKQHDSGYEYVHAITTAPVATNTYPSYQQYQEPYNIQQMPQPQVYPYPPNGNYF